jgi:hypothetical protein
MAEAPVAIAAARETFTRLGAAPMLARLEAAMTTIHPPAPPPGEMPPAEREPARSSGVLEQR